MEDKEKVFRLEENLSISPNGELVETHSDVHGVTTEKVVGIGCEDYEFFEKITPKKTGMKLS